MKHLPMLPDIFRRTAVALLALPILILATSCGQKTDTTDTDDTTPTATTTAEHETPASETTNQDDNELPRIVNVKITGAINYQGRVGADCDFIVTRTGQFKSLKVAGTITDIKGKICDVQFVFGPTGRSPSELAEFVPLTVGKPVSISINAKGGASGTLNAKSVDERSVRIGAQEVYTSFMNGTDSAVSIRIDSAEKLGSKETSIFPMDLYRIKGNATFTANIKNEDMTSGPRIDVEMTFDCVAEGNQYEKVLEAASQK